MAGPLGSFVGSYGAAQKDNEARYQKALDRLFQKRNLELDITAEERQQTKAREEARAGLVEAGNKVVPNPDSVQQFFQRYDATIGEYGDLGIPRDYYENRFGVQADLLRPGAALANPSLQGPPEPPDLPRPQGNPQAAGAAPPPALEGFRFASPADEVAYLKSQAEARSLRVETERGDQFNREVLDALGSLGNGNSGAVMGNPQLFGAALSEIRAHYRAEGYSDDFLDKNLAELVAAANQMQDKAAADSGRSLEREREKRLAGAELESYIGRALGAAFDPALGTLRLDEGKQGLYNRLLSEGGQLVEAGMSAMNAFNYLVELYSGQPGFEITALTPYARGNLSAPGWYKTAAQFFPRGAKPRWNPRTNSGGYILNGKRYTVTEPAPSPTWQAPGVEPYRGMPKELQIQPGAAPAPSSGPLGLVSPGAAGVPPWLSGRLGA